MRQIETREREIISFLAAAGGVRLELSNGQMVWEVNQEMGSIRADYCVKGRRVHPVSICDFDDADGVPVVVTLFLTDDGKFGELDFWKVNDEPLLRLPLSDDAFRIKAN